MNHQNHHQPPPSTAQHCGYCSLAAQQPLQPGERDRVESLHNRANGNQSFSSRKICWHFWPFFFFVVSSKESSSSPPRCAGKHIQARVSSLETFDHFDWLFRLFSWSVPCQGRGNEELALCQLEDEMQETMRKPEKKRKKLGLIKWMVRMMIVARQFQWSSSFVILPGERENLPILAQSQVQSAEQERSELIQWFALNHRGEEGWPFRRCQFNQSIDQAITGFARNEDTTRQTEKKIPRQKTAHNFDWINQKGWMDALDSMLKQASDRPNPFLVAILINFDLFRPRVFECIRRNSLIWFIQSSSTNQRRPINFDQPLSLQNISKFTCENQTEIFGEKEIDEEEVERSIDLPRFEQVFHWFLTIEKKSED